MEENGIYSMSEKMESEQMKCDLSGLYSLMKH